MNKTIFWDFDGVILDSMKVRDWGFEEIFKTFKNPEIKKLLKFHRDNGGLSRYVKIRYFFEKILNKSTNDKEIQNYANAFSLLMKKELVNPNNLIEDSLNFVKNNYKNYNFHIVSGSDQNELRFLCKKLKINKYFKSINGSPTSKDFLIKFVLENFEYSIKNSCLIGDSINDYEAAKANKIIFFNYNNKNIKHLGEQIKNFSNFQPFV